MKSVKISAACIYWFQLNPVFLNIQRYLEMFWFLEFLVWQGHTCDCTFCHRWRDWHVFMLTNDPITCRSLSILSWLSYHTIADPRSSLVLSAFLTEQGFLKAGLCQPMAFRVFCFSQWWISHLGTYQDIISFVAAWGCWSMVVWFSDKTWYRGSWLAERLRGVIWVHKDLWLSEST